MAKRRKHITMLLTVTVPHWCSAAQARKEVRDMLNSPNNWYLNGPDYQEGRLRAAKIKPA